MKQLLFLLLFPCLAMAQYQGNAGQKITLGEQTTADGLVYRGVENDTALITPFSDTSAYIILDTVNNKFYNYNRATNVWSLAGGGVSVSSFSAGSTGLTPSTATTGAVTLGGTLAVENGGTGSNNLPSTRILIGNGTSAIRTSSLFNFDASDRFIINNTSAQVGNSMEITAKTNGATVALLGRVSDGYSYISFHNNNNSITRFMIDQMNGSMGFYNTAYRMYINSNGNIGIGTTSPSGVLEVAGTSANTDFRISRTVSSSTYFYIKAPGGSPSTSTMGVNGVDVMVLNASGNVGIGTTTPAVQFHTTGGVRFAGLASITDLRTDANGDLFNGSDFNLKNSIDTINFGLSDVLKLKPVSFNWNNESRNISEYKSMGFIAQDVMDVIPNAASSMGDGDMQVDYNAIVATLTKAIQEQQALIKALEQRIINLENK